MSGFRLGLIINPYAGTGGPLGLKGSDALAGVAAVDPASRASERARRCLSLLSAQAPGLTVLGFAGAMAETVAKACGLPFENLGEARDRLHSCAEDTQRAARMLRDQAVDLILFVGGDGTARDIYRGLGDKVPVLGLPAGVKMHSGVYAVSPESAAEIVLALIRGELVEIAPREVRDIDESGLATGRVGSTYFGELLVPALGGFLQNVKVAGRESEELVLADIADYLAQEQAPETLYLFGPGSTTAYVMESWGLAHTLLGFDGVLAGSVVGLDLDAAGIGRLLDTHPGPVKAVITLIGGQGHLLGRGNQQLTPEIIRRIGRENFIVIASKRKITELGGRPLLVDSDDPELDRGWNGFIPVITGYEDTIMYRVGWMEN